MADYKDKTLLFVNVASKCGEWDNILPAFSIIQENSKLTLCLGLTPQYKDLQALHEKHGDKGLVIFGFPCNQFKAQEPGTDDEVLQFCQLNYGVTFPIAKKVSGRGKT